MNPLIEQFKRDAESFEKKMRSEWVNQIDYDDIQAAKSHIIQSTTNLVDKMIEECERRKKGMTLEKIKAEPNVAKASSMGMELGYDYSLSDTISQLQEFKEYLEELKK